MDKIFKLSRPEQIIVQLVLIVWAVIVITPLYVAINNSLKSTAAYVLEDPFALPPRAADGRVIFRGVPGTVIPVGTQMAVEGRPGIVYEVYKQGEVRNSGRAIIRVQADVKGPSGQILPEEVSEKGKIEVTLASGFEIQGLDPVGEVHRGGIPNGLETTFSNYPTAWTEAGFGDLFFNSVVISLSTVIIVVFGSTTVSFVLARMPFAGSNLILLAFMVGLLIPLRLAMSPLLAVIDNLGLRDNLLSVILTLSAMCMPMCVFILTSFFKQVSPELEQAARMDGATPFQIYFSVILPLVKPAVASVALISFVWAWNEYFLPLIMLSTPEKFPLTRGLQAFNSEYGRQWHQMFAAIMIMVVPTIIAFLLACKQFIAGLAAGGVKE